MKKLGAILLTLALAIGLAVPMAIPAAASPAPAIQGLWHFDETSGTTAADSSGNGNDGTLMGDATWTSGYYGNAVSLDGSGDYVSVPDSASLDISDVITVEAWVYLNSHSANEFYTVAGKWNDVGVDNRGYLLGVTTKLAGNLPTPRFYISSDGDDFPSASSSVTLSTGTWYHLAGTYDGQVLKIYVDGVEKGSNDLGSSTSIATNNEPLLIGGNKAGGGGAAYFDGLIDEVRIWNSDLPDFEVSAEPAEAYNGVTLEHEITATVDPVAPGVTVGLEVTAGPNIGETDSDSTDASGEVTLSYTSDGTAGTDTIRVWVDRNWNGTYDSGVDFATEVTKGWVTLVSLTPAVDFNPVDTEHEVEATISSTVDGVEVWFEVSGANSASGSEVTDDGVATFSYTGTNEGLDHIRAYFDADGEGDYDIGEPTTNTVKKFWGEPVCGLTIGFWKTNAAKDLDLDKIKGQGVQVGTSTYIDYLTCIDSTYGGDITDWEEFNISPTIDNDDIEYALHWLSYGAYQPQTGTGTGTWDKPDAKNPQVKAQAQLLALMLTACKKGADYTDALISVPGYGGWMTVAAWIDKVIDEYNNKDYEAVYDIANYLNENCAVSIDGLAQLRENPPYKDEPAPEEAIAGFIILTPDNEADEVEVFVYLTDSTSDRQYGIYLEEYDSKTGGAAHWHDWDKLGVATTNGEGQFTYQTSHPSTQLWSSGPDHYLQIVVSYPDGSWGANSFGSDIVMVTFE